MQGSLRRKAGAVLLCGASMMGAAVLLPGCATLAQSVSPSLGTDRLAADHGLQKNHLVTSHFELRSYLKVLMPGQVLRVYIEGDGAAWQSKHLLSNDPTPKTPLVVQLATLDSYPNVAYLARPCQYTDPTGKKDDCRPEYWAGARFSEEVIQSMGEALDKLKVLSGASQLELVGYSGGAAVGVLAAARRSDVVSLRTIAGNLDHEVFSRWHKISPLKRSLNPADAAAQLSGIPQIHFIGGSDTIVPAAVADRYFEASGRSSCVRVTRVPEAAHQSGWTERWPQLLREEPACT